MYPPIIAAERPDDTAFVMAASGTSLTYAELDRQSNQLAHLLRARGVAAGTSLLIVMENRIEWPVIVAAGMRSGMFVTPVNRYLSAPELAALFAEADPAAVVTTAPLRDAVTEALGEREGVVRLCADGADDNFEDLATAIADQPDSPIADETLGARVMYSGGTTGRPKAFRQQLLGVHPAQAPARHGPLAQALGIDSDTVLLSPAPNYHAAPFTFQLMVLAAGGTVVCMERFDAAAAMTAIERYQVTHSQWVPTMLLRLLRLDDRERIPLAPSHRVAVTSGAPCPVEVKEQINDWWGTILHEYYGASEGYGYTYISAEESRTHPGSVGRPLGATKVRIGDRDGTPLPTGAVGRVYFARPTDAAYRNTDEATDGSTWRSMGDSGYVDDEGFLYLAGRESFMIISGGVNIYPEQIEEVLVTHPDVADAAVFGVPDPEFGERVTALVELRPGRAGDAQTARALIEHCRAAMAAFKAPKTIEFVEALPRTDTGKLNKKNLRADYLAARSVSR
ncbi:fatty-acid--CoA ligase [Nocardia nova]|uniref:Fatty-acid--CoA ligase n=1 Tax=Nocardia nova TaxID=37330 RepID=A0A2S6AKD7_9NOCA|nr:AMP-binding protein [Nocardia nova]PPJ24933.1 fatty-acid--CoA ligase [Nocardia nova]PPJ35695.1 fatty-acid--CoA ligase [Nocardia nova]